jgi:dihydrofolate reductase
MARRLRYQVAVSLDGFIAGPNGEYDWIVMDPAIDFAAMAAEFDTAVMGRKTYEVVNGDGHMAMLAGMHCVVFSRTLPPSSAPGLRVVADDPAAVVAGLKAEPGKDIWLYGGGELFRALLTAGLVDTVELAVIPVLLGAGVPLLPAGPVVPLVLSDQKVLPASGIVALAYAVPGGVGPAPTISYVRGRIFRSGSGFLP